MKNSIFARFVRVFFIFSHFEDVFVLSMTWNDLFSSCVDDLTWAYDDKCSILSCPKHRFQFNSRIVKAHFSGIMTLNNWKVIAETRNVIFRWHSHFRRRRVCLNSLVIRPYERPTSWSFLFYKKIKKTCSECIVKLYKHAGTFKNTREVQRSTSRSIYPGKRKATQHST